MAGPEGNHANEIIEDEDFINTHTKLDALATELITDDSGNNTGAELITKAQETNGRFYEDILKEHQGDIELGSTGNWERTGAALALQVFLHRMGFGSTVKDIDGIAGGDTANAAKAWAEEYVPYLAGQVKEDAIGEKLVAAINKLNEYSQAMGMGGFAELMSDGDVLAKAFLSRSNIINSAVENNNQSATVLAVQILLKQKHGQGIALDGHAGPGTLAAAKAFAEEYDESAEEANKINWNDDSYPIPNAVLRRLAGITDVEDDSDAVSLTIPPAPVADGNSSTGPVVLHPNDVTDEVAAASAQSPEIFTAGGTTEVNNENLNEALTAANTELAKDNANKSWVEALLNAIFGLGPNDLSPNESQGAAGMLEGLVNDEQPVEDVRLRANSLNHLANYNLSEYQRLNDNTATAGQAATHASSALQYANQTLELTAAADAESMTADEISQLETSARDILAQLSSVPRFEAGETTNIFDGVTTLDITLGDVNETGARIPAEYMEDSDVNYSLLTAHMIQAFGLEYSSDFTKEEEDSGSRKKTWVTLDALPSRPSDNNLLADTILSGIDRIEDVQGLSERTKLDIARSAFLDKNIRNSFFHENEIGHGQDTRMLGREYVHPYYANLAFEGATTGEEQNLSETVREYFEVSSGSDNTIDEARLNDFILALKEHLDESDDAVLYSREFFRTAVNIEKARAALKPIESFWPLEASEDGITPAFSREALVAEDAPGFESLALFFSGKNILDPHQSAREFFLTLQEKRYGRNNQVVDMAEAFKQALGAFTNQNPTAAAALLQAESYKDLFGTPPADGEVTRAEPRQREEMSQNYIDNARDHALKQLRLTRNVVDGFVTGIFDGVPGDVNDKAEDAFDAMIARLEDTENHPNYVLDIPFGASIDAVAKPEEPQNAAIEANWENRKPILSIRVSGVVGNEGFGEALMKAIHGTNNSTAWDFQVNQTTDAENINANLTNEYHITVTPDGKLHTALQESGANPATWELALREILRAGMQHTQIEGEFFNPRTAHRRGMEAFDQQEEQSAMKQLRDSEKFLRNHEARASSLEINGETINTFAIERQVEGETYYVHVADGQASTDVIESMFPTLGGARVFVTKGSGENAELLHERGEIERVLSLRDDEIFPSGSDRLFRLSESNEEVGEYHGDHLNIEGRTIPTASFTYHEADETYLLHIAYKERGGDVDAAAVNPSAGFSALRNDSDDEVYEVFLTKKGESADVQTETLPLITDALLIERATRAVEQHLSGEAEAEEERTADFLDLFHHHSSQYEKAKEPDPTDGTATEFQHAIFEEINTSFAEINGTDYFVLDLEEAPSDIRVHLENAFQKDNKLYVPITGNKIPPVVVVTEDLEGGYKHEFLAVGDGKRPKALIAPPQDIEPTATLKTAPLVRHVHIAGQTAPDRVEASSAE